MNRFFTLLLAASCLTAVGQSEYCLDGTVWNEELGGCVIDQEYCGWQPDGNADGVIGVNDLLDLLAVYGDIDSDGDGIWDSADYCIGLYDVVGVCNGDCDADADGDGTCDDIDDCVGDYDECGVCNGSGIPSGECDCFGNTLDECGFCGGSGPDEGGDCCGSPFLHEGHYYPTAKIGNQCWFQENLRYLPQVSPDTIGSSLAPHYYVWNYTGDDVDEAKSTDSYIERGVLYNYPAAIEACPVGWSIPAYEDWIELATSFGEEVSTNLCAFCDQAFSNSSAFLSTGTNESGFTDLGSGYVYYSTAYGGGYTSSATTFSQYYTESGEWKVRFWKSSDYIEINQNGGFNYGYPVRCIKDTE